MVSKTITRTEAIELLRQKCMALVDEEHSLCQVAGRVKILCGGFSQWTFEELKQRHAWIVQRRPNVKRKELEALANRWQLARQFALEKPLACDVQMCEASHRVCRGWDEFTEEDLARFCQEMFGEEYCVTEEAGSSTANPGRGGLG